MALRTVKSNKAFGGWVKKFAHNSKETGTEMTFSVFLPKEIESKAVPVLYYLSGLTCTDDNFTQKAGAQRAAAEAGIALVAPDTSPRGAGVPGEDDGWDFGTGAGFYVNATTDAFKKNYRMYSYVTSELRELIESEFNVDKNLRSVTGHSMGGHGALIVALKNPGLYKSCSAFSPICNPINCPWGVKAFTGYLGEDDKSAWANYDASELAKTYAGPNLPMLVDQGAGDEFYESKQLLPESLGAAAAENPSVDLNLRMQEGYDHSYYFISTFMEDHVKFHAKHLQ